MYVLTAAGRVDSGTRVASCKRVASGSRVDTYITVDELLFIAVRTANVLAAVQ